METQLLKNAREIPQGEVLKKALSGKYALYEKFEKKVSCKEYEISLSWKYYKDVKSWLCKAVYKKKTVFWLSVWEGYFKTSFFFAGRLLEEIKKSDISDGLKKGLDNKSSKEKLIPVIVNAADKKDMDDIFKLISLKMRLK